KFALYPTVNGNYYTINEFFDKIKDSQTDKDGNTVILYAKDKEAQHAYIEQAKEKGYEVLLLDSPIVSHLIQKLEHEAPLDKEKNEKITFARVDGDAIDNLIKKEDQISKLNDDEKERLKTVLEGVVPAEKFSIKLEPMDSNASPFIIT